MYLIDSLAEKLEGMGEQWTFLIVANSNWKPAYSLFSCLLNEWLLKCVNVPLPKYTVSYFLLVLSFLN